MGFIIGLLTLAIVLDCLVLVFLVLLQLPKKEAGAGLAFGGGAADALFGAGQGNVLTKVTKYAATIFFVLAFLLAILQKNYHSRSGSDFMKQISQPAQSMPGAMPPSTAATPAPAAPAPVVPAATGSNQPAAEAPAAPATNAPAAPAAK